MTITQLVTSWQMLRLHFYAVKTPPVLKTPRAAWHVVNAKYLLIVLHYYVSSLL